MEWFEGGGPEWTLVMREVKHLVKDTAWRKVREGWREEAS